MLKVANSVINVSQITGVLPVVNGGTGVTTSTGTGNTVLSATPTLSGDVNLSTGNLVIGTSGKGVDFSITSHPAGMTSELLADYEEGTWTPTQGAGLTVVGAFSSAGNYTKIGNIVVLTGFVAGATSVAFASGGAIICGGLPFTVGGSALQVGNGINSANTVTTSCFANGTSVNSGGSFAANAQYHFSVSYRV